MITLESIREGDCLRIGLIRPGDSISSYGVMQIPIRHLEDCCARMIETLNRTTRKGIGYTEAIAQLKDMGALLCNDLLTCEIKETLLHTDEIHLSVRTDDRLVHIPWELICLDDEFLCRRFAMGRNVQTRQTVRRGVQRQISYPLQMWVVANPLGDLAKALDEGMEICDGMDRLNVPEVRICAFLGSEITMADMQKKIRTYDIVHFAGHADYDDRHPEQSGWKLKDSILQASDVKKMEGGAAMPLMVFSNACQSARTGEWGRAGKWQENAQDSSFGLANAFMISGVRHYIGTSWEIRDESGRYFALEFYRHLLAGNTIGQALCLSRQTMSERGQDAGWAAYVLYGDPSVSYFGQSEPKNLSHREKKSAPVPEYIIHSNSSAMAETMSNGIRSGRSDIAREVQPDIPESAKNPADRRGFLLGGVLVILMLFLAMLLIPPVPQSSSLPETLSSPCAKESVPEPEYKDEWTSRPLQMTVLYDSDGTCPDLEDMIAAAVEMKVAAEYPRIPLVDRQYIGEMLA
ncbi:MAG: CHAT domain-containing protein, partial [Desulfobacterales bacterium]